MITIGIDPGIATTGYGIVREEQDGRLTSIAYGVIQTRAGLSQGKRLLELYRNIAQLITLHQPGMGAVEKLFFEHNVKTALSVGEARGIALLAMAEKSVSIYEYTPMEIKQAVAGYGGAEKNQIQQMVKMILGLEDIPRPDDAADALAVAVCHIHSNKLKYLSNAQTE